MTTIHAVSWLDHRNAQVLQFDATQVTSGKVEAHTHYTRQHGSEVRTEHEFFGHVCDALAGIAEVLVTGPKFALADFKHYADKHRPETAKRIVAYEALDHVMANQLLAKGRGFFMKYDPMTGTPTPT